MILPSCNEATDISSHHKEVGTHSISYLYIVRHGETDWNAERRIQGQIDTHLNEKGRLQARNTARALKSLGILDTADAIVSSDLSRARETADLIASLCPGKPQHTDIDLRECHFGAYEGRILLPGEATRTWDEGDLDYEIPGGESGRTFIARGLRAFRSAAHRGSKVVVVSHGGLIRWTALSIEAGDRLFKESVLVSEMLNRPIRNGSCTTLVYDHTQDSFRIAGFAEEFLDSAACAPLTTIGEL